MERDIDIDKLVNPHVSVDCVLIGFDGEQLKVLLVKQVGQESVNGYTDMKLPGSLIYEDEDLDEAAQRVLCELTGLKNVNLLQFRVFWLQKIEHIILKM
jgi:NUDIX domain.